MCPGMLMFESQQTSWSLLRRALSAGAGHLSVRASPPIAPAAPASTSAACS